MGRHDKIAAAKRQLFDSRSMGLAWCFVATEELTERESCRNKPKYDIARKKFDTSRSARLQAVWPGQLFLHDWLVL